MKNGLKVYVAGASAEVDRVASYMRKLREIGCVITEDSLAGPPKGFV